jgi:cytochrome c-type biogenesis protein
MEPANLNLSMAFLAGLLSFASPCVLPLVPAYIGYLGGTAVLSQEPEKARSETVRTFLHSLLFVLGFGLVFVLLGASATFIGRFVFDSSILLRRVGGVLLVVFGMRLMATGWSRKRWIVAAVVVALVTFLFDSGLVAQGRVEIGDYTLVWLEESVLMGLVVLAGADWGTVRQAILAVAAGVLNFLASFDAFILNLLASALIAAAVILLNRADVFYAQKKIMTIRPTQPAGDNPGVQAVHGRQSGYLRSLLFGVVFAVGWTPCVGPILAGILIVASQLETVGQGVLLLTAYTLGLGIPFLLVGLAFGPVSAWLHKMNRYMPLVSVISGVLLVLAGILIFTDSLAFLSQYGDLFNIGL